MGSQNTVWDVVYTQGLAHIDRGRAYEYVVNSP